MHVHVLISRSCGSKFPVPRAIRPSRPACSCTSSDRGKAHRVAPSWREEASACVMYAAIRNSIYNESGQSCATKRGHTLKLAGLEPGGTLLMHLRNAGSTCARLRRMRLWAKLSLLQLWLRVGQPRNLAGKPRGRRSGGHAPLSSDFAPTCAASLALTFLPGA
jgi:hypothetical protein